MGLLDKAAASDKEDTKPKAKAKKAAAKAKPVKAAKAKPVKAERAPKAKKVKAPRARPMEPLGRIRTGINNESKNFVVGQFRH